MKSYLLSHFIKYLLPGVACFFLDLAFLWVLIEAWNIHYVSAAAIAFLVATSVNYFYSRGFVFKGSDRELVAGYNFFIAFAIIGAIATALLMLLFVETFSISTWNARIAIALIVGVFNFLLNFYVNFKMHHVLDKRPL